MNALGLRQGHKHKRTERPFPSIAGHLVHSSFDTQYPFPTNKLSGSLWSLAFSPSQTLFHPKCLIRNNCLIDLKTPGPGKHAFYTPGVVEIVRNSLQTDVFRNRRREAAPRAWARNLPKLRESQIGTKTRLHRWGVYMCAAASEKGCCRGPLHSLREPLHEDTMAQLGTHQGGG